MDTPDKVREVAVTSPEQRSNVTCLRYSICTLPSPDGDRESEIGDDNGMGNSHIAIKGWSSGSHWSTPAGG